MIADVRTLINKGRIQQVLDKPTESCPYLDITIGSEMWTEHPEGSADAIDPCAPVDECLARGLSVQIPGIGFALRPGRRCIVWSREFFEMGNYISGLVMLRSRTAQAGMDHAFSGGLKPGWSGHLALEISNANQRDALIIRSGQKIAQVCFFKLT